jgi:hypothetical protein
VPSITLLPDVASVADAWAEFTVGTKTHQALGLLIHEHGMAWRQPKQRQLFDKRANIVRVIVETAKSKNVPNDIGAKWWITAQQVASLTMWQVRDTIKQLNKEVKDATGANPKSKKTGPAFGAKYAEWLEDHFRKKGMSLDTGGHVRHAHQGYNSISDIEKCTEWGPSQSLL